MATDFYSDSRMTALARAVAEDDPPAIDAALSAGADVNGLGRHNVTPLMIAVDLQKERAVAALLTRGADPNAQATDGASPVSLAVENYRRNPRILEAVMKAGGSPDIRRPDREPVIMRFINDQDCQSLRRWTQYGANLNVTTRGGDPVITTAALRQDWDVVWCLLELGADYDYEGASRQPLSASLAGPYPSPDSPLHPYKVKVWEFLRDRGLRVPPLTR